VVLGLAGDVLLPVDDAGLRRTGQGDAGHRAVDAGLEGARAGGQLAVLELGGVLAEVPDVPVRSWAYQSKVSSTTTPSSLTVSRTTRAVMLVTISRVTLVAVTSTVSSSSSPDSR